MKLSGETDPLAQRLAWLEAVLWPQEQRSNMSVWAVLDCAREPAVYRALLDSRLEFRCLFSGRLPLELELVAPQLVEILPGQRLLRRWVEQGWGRSWGVLLRIEDPANLRHHLRKFLRVRDEQERPLLFRYYDPRVLGSFLPLADAQQRATLFGPIDSWLVEDGRAGLIEYRDQGLRGLQQRLLPWPGVGEGPAALPDQAQKDTC